MLNNKGFAVSAVLYTLLVAFLMFLGVALAQFSSSSTLISKANDELVNGIDFEAIQVIPQGNFYRNYPWYAEKCWLEADIKKCENSTTLVRIKSRYGTKYWPKDFLPGDDIEVPVDFINGESVKLTSGKTSGNIEVEYSENAGVDYPNAGKLIFKDTLLDNYVEVILVDVTS